MTIRGGGNPHTAMAAMPLGEWTRRLGALPAEAYDASWSGPYMGSTEYKRGSRAIARGQWRAPLVLDPIFGLLASIAGMRLVIVYVPEPCSACGLFEKRHLRNEQELAKLHCSIREYGGRLPVVGLFATR
jgi:hypothetical protein